MRLTDLRQKRSHLGRVHLVTQTPVQFPMPGTDTAINVGEFALVAVAHHRAQRSRSPTTSDNGPCGQSGPRPETSVESDARARPAQSTRPPTLGVAFFFHSSCRPGWVLGCRV